MYARKIFILHVVLFPLFPISHVHSLVCLPLFVPAYPNDIVRFIRLIRIPTPTLYPSIHPTHPASYNNPKAKPVIHTLPYGYFVYRLDSTTRRIDPILFSHRSVLLRKPHQSLRCRNRSRSRSSNTDRPSNSKLYPYCVCVPCPYIAHPSPPLPFLPLFLPFFHLPPGLTKRIVSVVDIFITPAEPRPSVPVCAPLAASQLLFPSPFPLALSHTTHSTHNPRPSTLCTPTPTPTRQLATPTPKSQGPTLHHHLAPSSHLDFLLHTYSYPSSASVAPTKLKSTVLSFFFFIFVPFLHFLATGNVPISNPQKRNPPTPTDTHP